MLAAERPTATTPTREKVIAELKNGPLAHLPSGQMNANAAWLVLAARVRLNEIAASTSHAAFAFICPEGRWASGPFFNSAMTFSTIAWSRWVASAASIDSAESVKTAWWRQAENRAPCPAGTVLGFREGDCAAPARRLRRGRARPARALPPADPRRRRGPRLSNP